MNTKRISALLLMSLVSLGAAAEHNNDYYQKQGNAYYPSHNQFYDYARVNSVVPIIETVEHRIPVQCNHQSNYNHSKRSATPVILGTIIGAAIGNELGHKKSNKQVGAVAGGILGASIGSDMNNRPRNHSCNDYEIQYEQRTVGYDVTYRYRGNIYHTTTQQHPGKRIRLRLQFQPEIS